MDHIAIVKLITDNYPSIPIVILAEDLLVLDPKNNLAKLEKQFQFLHLQALSKHSMRQLVSGYISKQRIGTEDVILSQMVSHMESINVHRTPLNCYTLLRVLDSTYGEKLLNKSKLLKAILFVLFTDSESVSYSSDKPGVDECTFVMGCFCKSLVENATRSFPASTFKQELTGICFKNRISLNIDALLAVLFDNNIIADYGEQYEFRHRYWIYYFAANWMIHDESFRGFILHKRNYVNYPEIVEFYAGIDGKRTDAVETILSDITQLKDEVDSKIGIGNKFDPLSGLLWNPSDSFIQSTRKQIVEKLESSNLPAEIKDQQADKQYKSDLPYDQSITNFLQDYSVLSLIYCIKTASRTLRNSLFVNADLKQNLTNSIMSGWEEVSRIIFWLSPVLAARGWAMHDGFGVILGEGFSDNLLERFKQIIFANPANVVRLLQDDLTSRKIGPLLYDCFSSVDSNLQKHLLSIFIARVRPTGWFDELLKYINLLHPRSFYMGKMLQTLNAEITNGDLEGNEETLLKQLAGAILSKCEYAPRVSAKNEKAIDPADLLSENNKLSIDMLLKEERKKWPKDI